MWDINQFKEFVSIENWGKIQKQIIDIVIYTLESVQDVVEHRKNTHEIFGFDLMVDSDYNTWLIEVNSSPSMEYSTEIKKRLVKMVMEDTTKVVIDYNSAKKIDKPNIDTGNWKLIHKGMKIETSTVPVGFEMLIQGTKIDRDYSSSVN